MNKKPPHTSPEDARTSRNEGKHKQTGEKEQSQKHHRPQHRSTSFSSDDRVFPSSSSSSESETDSSTNDCTNRKVKTKRGPKRNKRRKERKDKR